MRLKYQYYDNDSWLFVLVGLDWREYVVSDKGLRRPTDLAVSRGNPANG